MPVGVGGVDEDWTIDDDSIDETKVEPTDVDNENFQEILSDQLLIKDQCILKYTLEKTAVQSSDNII